MSTITLRAIKGSPLTNNEVDANFSNLNNDKLESSDAVSTNTANKLVKRDASGNFSAGTITATLSGNADTATASGNITGGSAGNILYQSGAGTTAKLAAGTAGQVLISNGTSAPSWSTFNALPSQSGNNGKYLTTDGSTASWATISAGITATDDTSTDASYYPALFTATSGSQSSARVSSTKLYFNPSSGTLNATVFNSLSDLNQKTNVVKIENATETLKQIDGFEFDWLSNGKHSAGVIAQYLEKVLPFLVETNEQGIKSVNYSGLIAYLIQSNKELVSRIEKLENQ